MPPTLNKKKKEEAEDDSNMRIEHRSKRKAFDIFRILARYGKQTDSDNSFILFISISIHHLAKLNIVYRRLW